MPYTNAMDVWIVVIGFAIAGVAGALTWVFTTLGKPPARDALWNVCADLGRSPRAIRWPAEPNIVELEMDISEPAPVEAAFAADPERAMG